MGPYKQTFAIANKIKSLQTKKIKTLSQKPKKEINNRQFKQNEVTTNEYRSDSISEIRKWKTTNAPLPIQTVVIYYKHKYVSNTFVDRYLTKNEPSYYSQS
jgi:thiamine biosynthesis protein ThiC